jgi:hypothetical protein
MRRKLKIGFRTFDESRLEVWRPDNFSASQGFPTLPTFDDGLEDVLGAGVLQWGTFERVESGMTRRRL